MVIPKASMGVEKPNLEEEEGDVISDGHFLSALVGSISEVDLEHSGLHSFYDLKASRRNSKSSAKKKSKRRSEIYTKPKIFSRCMACLEIAEVFKTWLSILILPIVVRTII
jgi:hypothetical protein